MNHADIPELKPKKTREVELDLTKDLSPGVPNWDGFFFLLEVSTNVEDFQSFQANNVGVFNLCFKHLFSVGTSRHVADRRHPCGHPGERDARVALRRPSPSVADGLHATGGFGRPEVRIEANPPTPLVGSGVTVD